MKKTKAGFTLIEIIVVLIIVGILAAIALPNFFANIKRSTYQEAEANFEQWKLNMESCLDMHIGAEGVCAQGGASQVTILGSNNFTYSVFLDAANTASTGTGISADKILFVATPVGDAMATDSIVFWRNSDGTWGNIGFGVFLTVSSMTEPAWVSADVPW